MTYLPPRSSKIDLPVLVNWLEIKNVFTYKLNKKYMTDKTCYGHLLTGRFFSATLWNEVIFFKLHKWSWAWHWKNIWMENKWAIAIHLNDLYIADLLYLRRSSEDVSPVGSFRYKTNFSTSEKFLTSPCKMKMKSLFNGSWRPNWCFFGFFFFFRKKYIVFKYMGFSHIYKWAAYQYSLNLSFSFIAEINNKTWSKDSL